MVPPNTKLLMIIMVNTNIIELTLLNSNNMKANDCFKVLTIE